MEAGSRLTVEAKSHTFIFSKKGDQLRGVSMSNRRVSFADSLRFTDARRADRPLDQSYNHDDEKAKEKDHTYSEFPDVAVFMELDVKGDGGNLTATVNYELSSLDKT